MDLALRAGEGDASHPLIERLSPAFPTIGCGLFLVMGWMLEGRGFISSAFIAAAYVSGGYRPAREGLALLRHGRLHVDLLMVIAALAAAAIGLPLDGAVLIFIFALSNTLEDYALRRSRREMTALMGLRPTHAAVVRDGEEQWVDVQQLVVGDRVVVRPGGQIPCDGRVVEGQSLVDQSSITGESAPVDKMPGSDVFAGTINQTGSIIVEVTKEPGTTMLDRIVELVEQARFQKSGTQRSVDRFEAAYSWAVIIGVAITFAILRLGLGWPLQEALFRSIVLLIIASPCAIVLSSMPAILSAMSFGARRGMLIKGGGYLEQLGKTRVVAFDKTGTLTTGRPAVSGVESWHPDWSEGDILRMAASVEAMVDHPIGEAVLTYAEANGLHWERGEDVQVHVGVGVSGNVNGHRVWIGSPARVLEAVGSDGAEGDDLERRAQALAVEGKTPVAVAVDGDVVGMISISEVLRPGAAQVIDRLKRAGVERIVMLTGDNEASAGMLAARLGIDYRANLLPDDKVKSIQALQEEYGGGVMMVGDGVNDGPALAQADVGVAMGAAGTDVALEAADVVLMADDLEQIPVAVLLGRRVNQTVTHNLTFAVAVIVGLVIANFSGWLTLPMAIVGHEGSSLLVALNGLRMLRPRGLTG